MRRIALATTALALALWPAVAFGQGSPSVAFKTPANGATVTGAKVQIVLDIKNLTTVDAGSPVKDGEGHAHVFVDRDPVAAGQPIPTDQSNIVHFGKAPYDTRSIDLQPGKHTLTAELG